MQKIGFFGGSFNPPINTHIKLAENLIKYKMVDKVIFVPVGDYYQKKDLISAEHRYNMLQLVCKNFQNIDVDDIASSSQDKLFAIDTFKLLYEKYNKKADLYFIMGSDNFNKMPTWKNYQELMEKYKFIVIEREKNTQKDDLKNVIFYKSDNIEDITSTCIRNKIKNNIDYSNYIDDNVLKYIKENRLYI